MCSHILFQRMRIHRRMTNLSMFLAGCRKGSTIDGTPARSDPDYLRGYQLMRQHLKNEVRAFCGENNLPPARFAEAKDVKPRLGCSIEGAPKWLSPHIERLGRVPDKKLANELG